MSERQSAFDAGSRKVSLLQRLETLENEVKQLAQLTAHHVADTPRILWGWRAIESYMRRPKRSLSRYVKLYEFPVFRLGKFVLSSPHIIDSWLIVVNRARRERKALLPGELSDAELWAKVRDLERKLSLHAKDGKDKI